MGVQDWITAYQIGMSHLKLDATKIVIFGTVAILTAVAAGVFYDGYARAWHRHHMFPWQYIHTMLLSTCIGPLTFFVLMPLLLWVAAARKITLQDLGIVLRLKGGRSVILWQRVSGIIKGEQHIAICSSNFDALIIPLRAFPNEQAAENFYVASVNYWHASKGTRPPLAPDVSGVWPPAPTVGNSVEPDAAP